MSILTDWKRKAVLFLKRNERIFVFAFSLVIACGLSFELGMLYKGQVKDQVLVIEKPTVSLAQIKKEVGIPEGKIVAMAQAEAAIAPKQEADQSQNIQTSCTFVGSKNSDKYHSPSCSYAKRIKPENVVCFKNKEEAEGRGYTAGCIQ